MNDPYANLGVPRDADDATIRDAYRGRAKRAHPDAGGDPDEFHKLHTAYLVLSDPVKRKRFDETGSTDTSPENPLAVISGIIVKVLNDVIDQNIDVDREDLVGILIDCINNAVAEIRTHLEQARADLARLKRTRERFKYKGDRQDIISGGLSQRIDARERQILAIAKQITDHESAAIYVRDYGYEFEADIVWNQSPTSVPVTFQWVRLGGGA